LPNCFARLHADYPQASPEAVLIYQDEAVELAQLLLATQHAKLHRLAELQVHYRLHPNHAIFASLPAAGEWIGPALLAKFGDDPQRFPTANCAQELAGTCPLTRRSGKSRSVKFRLACDKEWRYICQEWALALVNRTQSPIAVAYYDQIRPHCHSDQHAYRCVANRWLAIAWKLWHDGLTYSEAYHFQQRAIRSKPR
jgi:transposase